MGRVKVNLTLDAEVAETARSLGLNLSRLAETAILKASKAERNRLWREENQTAIDAYAEEIAPRGLPQLLRRDRYGAVRHLPPEERPACC